jgi:predicted adenine nucleotide alpha hydrolase (AANH) superfamily ATPase
MCSTEINTEKLLLHTCCGPCATRVMELLSRDYRVTAFFFNPNIDPAEEYLNRFRAIEEFCRLKEIELISGGNDHQEWLKLIAGLEHQPEGGRRCDVCFFMRLRRTAMVAAERGFTVFGTTLSISPHKDSLTINRIGGQAAHDYAVRFIEEDFKQDNGYRRSCELSRQYGLYRQKYCGCEYSNR